jgi:hypothetical protein
MNAMTNLHARRPVGIRPISASGLRTMEGDRRATHASAEANYIYITRGQGADARGPLDYRHRGDLIAQGLELPAKHPRWAEEPGRVWREVDVAMTSRALDDVRGWHVVVTLPSNVTSEGWVSMVRDYAMTSIARYGPAVAWAIHAKGEEAGGSLIRPHAHLIFTTRQWKHGPRHGETVPAWCGSALTERLHGEWLARLPPAMRSAAREGYRCGAYEPAHLDCSALAALFG